MKIRGLMSWHEPPRAWDPCEVREKMIAWLQAVSRSPATLK
jgi:hypothetical protein